MPKRPLELMAAAAGLFVLSPLLSAIAIAIKITSAGPVFFRQQRVGRYGRLFSIYKFRTMQDETAGERFLTVGGDGRITVVGRFLRRWKLDELPQIINVVRGEMAFVGPRPEVPKYVRLFQDQFALILRVRPGITHRAAILFRHEEEMLARVPDPERFYCERIMPHKLRLYRQDLDCGTLWDDVRVIVATVLEVTRGSPGDWPVAYATVPPPERKALVAAGPAHSAELVEDVPVMVAEAFRN